MMFIENAGQWDEGARFQVWGGPGETMWLAEDAIWITVVEPGQGETDRQSPKEAEADLRSRLSSDDRVKDAIVETQREH